MITDNRNNVTGIKWTGNKQWMNFQFTIWFTCITISLPVTSKVKSSKISFLIIFFKSKIKSTSSTTYIAHISRWRRKNRLHVAVLILPVNIHCPQPPCTALKGMWLQFKYHKVGKLGPKVELTYDLPLILKRWIKL